MTARQYSFRLKPSDTTRERIEKVQRTNTLSVVQSSGPTNYVIKEEETERKYRVLIGSSQSCSCGSNDLCEHVLYVMLKVLKVPHDNQLIWQTSLLDSEVASILSGQLTSTSSREAAKHAFLRRKNNEKHSAQEDSHAVIDAKRLDLVEGEVCAICQDEMSNMQHLTFCKRGCGNNFHIECLKMYAENKQQSKQKVLCPLCRCDWGTFALSSLRKETEQARRASTTHKTVCKKCGVKPICGSLYRCIQCRGTNLCAHCYNNNVHKCHQFVVKKTTNDMWSPAPRNTATMINMLNRDQIHALETRELTTTDYDVLLQLDEKTDESLPNFLIQHVRGERRKFRTIEKQSEDDICTICKQSNNIGVASTILPCRDRFHDSCLLQHFMLLKYDCPNPKCEFEIFPGLHKRKRDTNNEKVLQVLENNAANLERPETVEDALFIDARKNTTRAEVALMKHGAGQPSSVAVKASNRFRSQSRPRISEDSNLVEHNINLPISAMSLTPSFTSANVSQRCRDQMPGVLKSIRLSNRDTKSLTQETLDNMDGTLEMSTERDALSVVGYQRRGESRLEEETIAKGCRATSEKSQSRIAVLTKQKRNSNVKKVGNVNDVHDLVQRSCSNQVNEEPTKRQYVNSTSASKSCTRVELALPPLQEQNKRHSENVTSAKNTSKSINHFSAVGLRRHVARAEDSAHLPLLFDNT